jgi:hypothetical protein
LLLLRYQLEGAHIESGRRPQLIKAPNFFGLQHSGQEQYRRQAKYQRSF